MPGPSRSLEQAYIYLLLGGWRESRGTENDWNPICFYSAHKTLSPSSLFPLICPTSPRLSCQASPPCSDSAHRFLPGEIKREKERRREGGERWCDASVLSRDRWEQREATWRARAHVFVCVSVWLRVFVYSLVKCTIVHLSSSAGGKARKQSLDIWRGKGKWTETWEWENGRGKERRQTQLWHGINSVCH